MIISIKHEVIVFWSSFLCGQAIGMLWDFFRCIRKKYKHSKPMVAFEDTLFCVISFRLFFGVCNICNNGGLRWYIFAALILSGILYFCTLSPFIRKLWKLLLDMLSLLIYPFKKLILIFYALTKRLSAFFISKGKVFSNYVTKKCLKGHK